MDAPGRLDRDQARLKDMWDNNVVQGTWLSKMIRDH